MLPLFKSPNFKKLTVFLTMSFIKRMSLINIYYFIQLWKGSIWFKNCQKVLMWPFLIFSSFEKTFMKKVFILIVNCCNPDSFRRNIIIIPFNLFFRLILQKVFIHKVTKVTSHIDYAFQTNSSITQKLGFSIRYLFLFLDAYFTTV